MKLQVAAIQMPCEILDLPANLQRADELIRTARERGAELVVLPELFNTGYSLCPDFGPCSETAEGPTLSYLRQRSRRWKMAIAAGFVEREGRHLFDSLAFCTPGWRDAHLSQAQPGVLGTISVPSRTCSSGSFHVLWADRLRNLRRHDLPQGLGRLPRADRPGRSRGRMARLRQSPYGPTALATRPCRSSLERDSGEGRDRSGDPGDLRQSMRRDPDHHSGSPHDDLGSIRRPEQHLRWPSRYPRPRRPGTLGSGRTHHPPLEARFEIVEFYVPLGVRGFLLRVGTFVIGILGGLVYRQAARRRACVRIQSLAVRRPGGDPRDRVTNRDHAGVPILPRLPARFRRAGIPV